jgi:hypothetical protein
VARVFISHASEDRDLAAEIRLWLLDDGHDVFLSQDPRDGIIAGDDWEQRLYERLRWADAVVCVITAAYRDSVWCTAEAASARVRGSRLVPFLVQPDVHHPLLAALQHVDYDGDASAARSALLGSLREVDATGGLGWPDGRNPFPGLRPFGTELHSAFFGRGEEIAALASLLRSPAAPADVGLTLVVGPSGCGKSSLVRAGLKPLMAMEADWLVMEPFLPGRDPVSALAGELAVSGRRLGLEWALTQVQERIAGGGLAGLATELLFAATVSQRRPRHLLVIVDQFEELLTQAEPAGRAAFAAALRSALAGSVHTVGTMRPESLPELLASEEFDGLPLHTFTLRPLRPETLPEVIVGPARLAGIEIDEHLLNRAVADTGSGEALPLLAFTLSELAAGARRGSRLSMQRYQELGGVHGALKRQADAALAAACAAGGRGRGEVICGLLRLVTVDERGVPTRWRAPRDELPEPVRVELDVFVERRLLTIDTDERGEVLVRVAHEAILSAWPPLAEGIVAVAPALRARRVVEQAACDWDERGRPPRALWDGSQLTGAVDAMDAAVRRDGVLTTARIELSPRARGFILSSIRRARRRRRLGAAALPLSAAAGLVAGGIAFALTHPGDVARLQLAVNGTDPVAVSCDGHTMAVASRDGSLALWDLSDQTHAKRLAVLSGHPARDLAFSPNGAILVIAGPDGIETVWDVTKRTSLTPIATHSVQMDGFSAVTVGSNNQTVINVRRDGTEFTWKLTQRPPPMCVTGPEPSSPPGSGRA